MVGKNCNCVFALESDVSVTLSKLEIIVQL